MVPKELLVSGDVSVWQTFAEVFRGLVKTGQSLGL